MNRIKNITRSNNYKWNLVDNIVEIINNKKSKEERIKKKEKKNILEH